VRTFRLLGVDVHAVSEPRVGHAACLRLLSDHVAQAARGAGLRVVVGDGDVHGAVGRRLAHSLQGPLLPLLADCGAAEERSCSRSKVTGAGASIASLVQEPQKLGCRGQVGMGSGSLVQGQRRLFRPQSGGHST